MKKNYKLVLGLVAGLAVGSIMIQPTTTEAKIQYETPKQAGQKWYKAQTEAYNGKKKVSVTFNIKAKNEKQADAVIRKLYVEAAKAQYGNQFISRNMTDGTTDYLYTAESFKKVKKGVYCWKITINGKSGTFRREYREAGYNKKLLADLTPLTKGKNQFDKAWITMEWLRDRAYYQCGRNQDNSNKALWKKKYHADCDDLAGTYGYYAKAAGVKKVGMISVNDSDGGHSWNYIVVNGRMYFIDFQSTTGSCLDDKAISAKRVVSLMHDPDFLMQNWDGLSSWNKSYREDFDADAKDEITIKAVYNKMTIEQKKAAGVDDLSKYSPYSRYQMECESWSQSHFLPVKVFCSYGIGREYTVKQIKKNCYWDGSNHKGKCPYPKAIY